MRKNSPMICVNCGVEMNQHAEKINYALAMDGSTATDPDLGGVIEEFHSCPRCGRTDTRRADVGSRAEDRRGG